MLEFEIALTICSFASGVSGAWIALNSGKYASLGMTLFMLGVVGLSASGVLLEKNQAGL